MQPTQPPHWTQYNQQPQPPRPRSWFARQVELSEQSVQRWSRSLNVPVPVLWVAILCVVLVSCSFWSIAGIAALATPGASSSAQVSATSTDTSAPTAAPIVLIPTATIGPSPTPAPTITPQPSPTPLPPAATAKQAIAAQLTADGQTTDGLKVTWDASTKTLTVEHNASDNLTNDLIKTGIQLDAFSVMKAAYTKWDGHPDTVIFHDNGQTQDKYGNTSTGPWGTAVLNSDTAALFNWGNLDYAQAWNAYDVAYYINGL